MTPFPEAGFAGLDPITGRKLSALVSRLLSGLHKQGYGVLASIDLADLARFREEYAEHPDCRSPHTAFDAEYHPSEIAAQGLFLTREQTPVGTVWRRIVPLRRNLELLTLRQSLEGLHLFYEDPGLALRRETCAVTSKLARMIEGGSVCFGGAAWHHPEHRSLGLFKTMALLSLVLCITSPEPWDWFAATVEEKNREKYMNLFPYQSWNRDVTHVREIERHFWLCLSSYEEVVETVMKAAE